MPRFAKYRYAHHPAMRHMLVEGRYQALERALALLQVRLAQAQGGAQRQRLASKIDGVQDQLARLRRLMAPEGED